ncbi:hypothetical protein AB0P21_03635 [Kribbella sp. NPDC056861]|uniref:hypothetical protein n=1 Tax=Kribbella sp. NPDC056861 TaxID=3154857 RepID=UPI0034303FFF
MSKQMNELWAAGLGLLRYEPTEMRLRARSGGRELVDTNRGRAGVGAATSSALVRRTGG